MRAVRNLVVVLVCLAAAAAAFSAGYLTHLLWPDLGEVVAGPTDTVADPGNPAPDEAAAIRVYWEAWHLLEDNFLGTMPSLRNASYAAVRGMVQELGDPHTIFVEPTSRQLEKDEHRGRFGGIGAWVYQRESDRLIVLTPIQDGPSARAGLLDGDVVVQVDDTVIDPLTMTRDDVVALIRGEVDTKVRIVVRRDGEADHLVFEVIRQEYEMPSVEWRMLEERAGDVGYLRITLFTERTAVEVEEAVKGLVSQGAQRLILDLRDNPGGLLDSAVAVTSQFLDEGVVLYEQRRDGSEKPYPVRSGGIGTSLPLVVLTNAGTASASEIVAGALRDSGRAVIVGETTYGKGSVQLVFDLSDGSSIHVTVARWLTPNRSQIEGVGIEPDEVVTLSAEDRAGGGDPQLAAAIARCTEL